MFYDMTHDKKITISLEKELIGERKYNQNVVDAEDWTYAHWEPVKKLKTLKVLSP